MSLLVPEVDSYLRKSNAIWQITSVVPNMTIEGFRTYTGMCVQVDMGGTRLMRKNRTFVSRHDGVYVTPDPFGVASNEEIKCEYIDKFEHEVLKLGDIAGPVV